MRDHGGGKRDEGEDKGRSGVRGKKRGHERNARESVGVRGEAHRTG